MVAVVLSTLCSMLLIAGGVAFVAMQFAGRWRQVRDAMAGPGAPTERAPSMAPVSATAMKRAA